MKVRFKDRVALVNTLVAAITTAGVFLLVYGVVFYTSYNHLDSDIQEEAATLFSSLHWSGDSLYTDLLPSREEKEHQHTDVNPAFFQVVNTSGEILYQSANLQLDLLPFDLSVKGKYVFNSQINSKRVRVSQYPLHNEQGAIIGHLCVGVSREESAIVLKNLKTTLLLTFPFVLLVLYLASSLAASTAISPVHQLIRVASQISDATIDQRLPLPGHKDEIYKLANTINDLLWRIESGLHREKQFTSDASHELRTPLAAIRGTLEVLIRKDREPSQYAEKIEQVIRQVDRIDQLLDQLLQLTRLEAGQVQVKKEDIQLFPLFLLQQEKWQPRLDEKRMQFHFDLPPDLCIHTDSGLLERILDNLIDNAIKYGNAGGQITCTWNPESGCLSIHDNGPGIPAEHLPKLFDRFYRTDQSRNARVKGTGLGLSIVKKLTTLLDIRIEVSSHEASGTTFCLFFPVCYCQYFPKKTLLEGMNQ
ncbi:MAG: HAMP domain-containing histidine kinase [Lewinellaceae bacterium]|nr:HAMP domain-containing histidine kinase [Lewinellaceae bacterium]